MTTDSQAQLAAFRQQIDALDDKLIALLKERVNVVSLVGEWKRKHFASQYPMRPGREAEMVRRVHQAFEGSAFLPEAAAAMWRIIIGMSINVESPLRISVFTPERDNDLFWLAREYFGAFSTISRQPHIKRVIGDVLDNKASVGIVPMLRSSDTTYWWTNLMEPGQNIPKVFARIPFVCPDNQAREFPAALAIGRIAPEETGDDISLIVLEAEHNVSQNRLQTAFAMAKLQATWINVATLSPATRHHLLEVKGFVTLEHPAMQTLLGGLGNSIFNTCFLGAYAAPIKSALETANEAKSLHVK